MQPTPTTSSAGFRPHAPTFPTTSRVVGLLLAAAAALTGCRDPKIAAYNVPKEHAADLPATAPTHSHAQPASEPMASPAPAASAAVPAAGDMAASPHGGLQTAAGLALTWNAPASWQPKAASMMRKATFSIGGEGGATADLAVTAFPGDVGGEIANVNRWRGQVGLGPVSDADATGAITRIEANGLKIGVVDIADASAANATRLIGAWVPYDGATWFFKLLGPDAVVAKEKPAFLEFLKTIKPAPAAATP